VSDNIKGATIIGETADALLSWEWICGGVQRKIASTYRYKLCLRDGFELL